MPISQGVVNAPSNVSIPDSTSVGMLQGKAAEAIVAELHGKYYTQTYRGNVYILSTVVAGVAVPISTTTAPNFGLWNPAGNTKLAVPLLYTCSYVSGTSVGTSIALSYLTNAGSNIATGSAVTAFTAQTPVNAYIGLGANNSVRAFSAATTNAPTFLMTLGFMEYAAIATSAISPVSLIYDFHGALILPPNNLLCTTGPAATGALLEQTLVWEEVPV